MRKPQPLLLIGCLGTLLVLAVGCSTPPKFPIAEMARHASFEPMKPGARLQGTGLILVPKDLLKAMPSLDSGADNLWLWFYRTGLGTAFDQAEIIEQLPADTGGSRGKVVVKPELWGYFFQRYGRQWTCWLEFKIRFLSPQGKQRAAFLAEGDGTETEAIPALASALRGVIRKYQRTITNSKQEDFLGP